MNKLHDMIYNAVKPGGFELDVLVVYPQQYIGGPMDTIVKR